MVVYDYKFPTLATKLYYHYKKNQKLGKLPKGCKFNMINFVDVEYSRRVNPIQAKYINNLAAASETAETLLEIPAERQERGRRWQRPVLPDLGRELPCRLHLFLRELRAGAL